MLSIVDNGLDAGAVGGEDGLGAGGEVDTALCVSGIFV